MMRTISSIWGIPLRTPYSERLHRSVRSRCSVRSNQWSPPMSQWRRPSGSLTPPFAARPGRWGIRADSQIVLALRPKVRAVGEYLLDIGNDGRQFTHFIVRLRIGQRLMHRLDGQCNRDRDNRQRNHDLNQRKAFLATLERFWVFVCMHFGLGIKNLCTNYNIHMILKNPRSRSATAKR